METKSSIPSISNPRSVNKSPVFSASQSNLMNCFSQLYEIFMLALITKVKYTTSHVFYEHF